MTLRLDLPHLRVVCKHAGAWCLPVTQKDALRAAIRADHTWFASDDIWGQHVEFKLKGIVAILERTEASIALGKAEDDEEKEREPSWK